MSVHIDKLEGGQSVELKMVLKVPDWEAMEQRGDKWWHFWRPTIWRNATIKDIKNLSKELGE